MRSCGSSLNCDVFCLFIMCQLSRLTGFLQWSFSWFATRAPIYRSLWAIWDRKKKKKKKTKRVFLNCAKDFPKLSEKVKNTQNWTSCRATMWRKEARKEFSFEPVGEGRMATKTNPFKMRWKGAFCGELGKTLQFQGLDWMRDMLRGCGTRMWSGLMHQTVSQA